MALILNMFLFKFGGGGRLPPKTEGGLACSPHRLVRRSIPIRTYAPMFCADVLITSGMASLLAVEYVHTARGVTCLPLRSLEK